MNCLKLFDLAFMSDFGKFFCKMHPLVNFAEEVDKNLKVYTKTVRHRLCKLLISSNLQTCAPCKAYRSDIFSMRKRKGQEERTRPSSHATLTNMSKEELVMRCKALQEERRHLTRTNISLHKHVSTMMANESVTVSDKQATILMKEVESLGSMLADNTAEKLLWEEQMKAVKSRKNMRWHPSIIRCCIAIQSKSASAYRVLREAGFIRLPHESTLKKYTQYTDAKVGIQHDALETLLGQIDQTKPQNTKITKFLMK